MHHGLRGVLGQRLSSATLTLVPLMVKEIQFYRGANLQVFTHACLTSIVMAAMAHFAKMPLLELCQGNLLEERDFPRLT